MAYDIAAHPLLSADALALDTDPFAEHAALAHDLLGLADTAFTGAAAESAKRFLALQVNYQVETGVDAAIYALKVRGSRTVSYKSASADLVRPGLLEEVEDLLEEEEGGDGSWGDRQYSVITSFR